MAEVTVSQLGHPTSPPTVEIQGLMISRRSLCSLTWFAKDLTSGAAAGECRRKSKLLGNPPAEHNKLLEASVLLFLIKQSTQPMN